MRSRMEGQPGVEEKRIGGICGCWSSSHRLYRFVNRKSIPMANKLKRTVRIRGVVRQLARVEMVNNNAKQIILNFAPVNVVVVVTNEAAFHIQMLHFTS